MSALYTREERMAKVLSKIDWQLFAEQQSWLYDQFAKLEPGGIKATHSVEGLINLMDSLEDACTAESCEATWYMDDELSTVPVNHEGIYNEELRRK